MRKIDDAIHSFMAVKRIKRTLAIAALLAAGTLQSHGGQGAKANAVAPNAPAGVTATDSPFNSARADKTWKELQRTLDSDPSPPLGFMLKGISGQLGPEDIQKFIGGFAIPTEIRFADVARDFYRDYAGDERAMDAHILEYDHLTQAYRMTPNITNFEALLSAKAKKPLMVPPVYIFTNLLPRMEALEALFAQATNLSEQGRYRYRIEQLDRRMQSPLKGVAWDEFAAAALAILREFPEMQQKKSLYSYLRRAMEQGSQSQARSLAEQVVASSAPDEEKARFKGYLHLLDSVGKPLAIQFTSLDGKTVDTSQMPGKVVLVDFWATTYVRSVADMPMLKALYEKYHPQGLEIVGVSLDDQEDKGKLTKFINKNRILWPQYFDGRGLTNKMAIEFGVNVPDVIFIIDKHGALRVTNARTNIEGEVKDLLAEP